MIDYEQVLYAFQTEGDGGIAMNPEHSKEALDAWLRSVKADAWDEGYGLGIEVGHRGDDYWEKNPYRSNA